MRVSTLQFYQRSTNSILNTQSNANQSVLQISDGKRVQTAKDDVVAANSILNFRQEKAVTEQYQRNITFAESRIALEETSLQSSESVMLRVKELVLQSNSGAIDQTDRQAIANELEARFDELLALANTRDESGNYVFAGYESEAVPFIKRPDGLVQYMGDNGQRETTVGNGVSVSTSDPGSKVFMAIPNALGDFSAGYNLNTAFDEQGRGMVNSARIADRANYVPAAANDSYNIDFVDVAGSLEVTVSDATGTQRFPALPATSAPFAAGDTLAFNGIEVVIEGTPQDGDQIQLAPEKEKDVFSVIRDAINWLETPLPADGAAAVESQLAVGTIIDDIGNSQIHFDSVRAQLGARLQITENQENIHQDYIITVDTAKGSLEDLDMVEAITEFERQKLALQASQSAFSQVQGLSLLNFL